MSWSIYETEQTEKDINALNTAISKAVTENTILYCAGQDQDQYERTMPKSWPGSTTNNALKKIGSAKTFGDGASSVNPRYVDYLIPGTLADSKSTETTSSAATARAAGVAALILWCAEACRAHRNEKEAFNFREDYRMNTLFDRLRSDQSTASLVDVTGILKAAAAAADKDCPDTVVKMCREKLQ